MTIIGRKRIKKCKNIKCNIQIFYNWSSCVYYNHTHTHTHFLLCNYQQRSNIENILLDNR